MPLPVLLNFAIISALSVTTLGQVQTNTTECIAAMTRFSQSSSCFGSEEGLAGFRSQFSNFEENSLTRPSALFSGQLKQIEAELMTLYNNLCTSQHCVNLYANVADNCYTDEVGT